MFEFNKFTIKHKFFDNDLKLHKTLMMKTFLFILVPLIFIGCTTPARLGMSYKGQQIISSSSNPIKNPNIDMSVNPLTKHDNVYDAKRLRNRFIPYIYKNEVLSNIIKKYPDTKIEMVVTPSENIKRTWILDAAFFYPFCGFFPITPWWGSVDLSAEMSIIIPNMASSNFMFNASEPFFIVFYTYYTAGRILTEKYSVAYNTLFEQVSKFNFNELEKKANLPTDRKYTFKHKSDIDIDIPVNNFVKSNTFALIIGNEDYSSYQVDLTNEINVDYASNDAKVFKDYVIKTLGVPEQNVILLINATYGQMQQGIAKLNKLSKLSEGNAELIFYYAGHGLPDEATKEAYIMPVDISGSNVISGIKLNDVYKKLLEFPNKKVTVFLDACFSGGARNQELIAMRGVKIQPKRNALFGNLVVFSSSSGNESSASFKEKKHGLFTYYLLKKLQESKGALSYKELSDYLKQKVILKSVLINSKEQTPQTNVSPDVKDTWQEWKFIK